MYGTYRNIVLLDLICIILKAKMYGNNIENCHAECIASGTIPIFHKHFGDNVIHRVQEKVCTECKDTGTIFLDETNFC